MVNVIELMESLFDIPPCGLLLIDKDYSIVYANDEFIQLTGYQSDTMIGSTIGSLDLFVTKTEEARTCLKDCLIGNPGLRKNFYLKDISDTYKLIFLQSRSIPENLHQEIGASFCVVLTDLSNVSDCERLFDKESQTEHIPMFHGMAGKDKKMKEIFKMIGLAAESNSTVLITGESGTGKELVARSIHDLSSRKNEPFVAVNCSALSESLLESELFGHIKGSFTGAYGDKVGKFEAARGGTIFLDEIGDISPLIQLKLLRVMQEKTFTRVGDNREIKIDMRIITATNKNLRKLITKGEFREDLFYRLKVFPIHTVPLRDRKNDIPILTEYFVKKFNKETGKDIKGVTMNAMRLMMDYCWPGNVREFENCIEHAFVICNNDRIDVFDLPQELRVVDLKRGLCSGVEDDFDIPDIPYIKEVKTDKKPVHKRVNISKDELIELLELNSWNKAETARQIGISRVALWKKMKKLGIGIE